MTISLIPTTFDGTPFYDQVTPLDGVNYRLSFRYNQRARNWEVSVYSADGQELAMGIGIRCNVDLFELYRHHEEMPRGGLFAMATNDATLSPDLTELGDGRRVSLYYFTADELT